MSDRDSNGQHERLVIFGAGSLARLARSYFARDSSYEIVAFTVHREHISADTLDGLPVVAFEDLPARFPPSGATMFVAVGYSRVNRGRAAVLAECRALGYRPATLVSSRASCWDDLRIGANCLVFDGTVIEPGVSIGDGVIIWSGCQISHGSTLGDCCFVAPNAVVLGDASIGALSFIGANATVRDGVSVGEACVIGAGCWIGHDTREGEVYVHEPDRSASGRLSSDLTRL